MKFKSLFAAWLGALLFLAGVMLGLTLSGAVVWAESESVIYSSYNGETRLVIRCPVMISPAQSAVIEAEIVNQTKEDIKPVVTAEISHGKVPREIKQTISLGPRASRTVDWVVDSSDAIFERLILVNALQSPYRDNPSRSGSCGIFIFGLFGLGGMQTFALVFAASVLLMLSGGGLWVYARRPLDQFSESVVRINSILSGLTIVSLLCALTHRWGLTIFFDVVIVLILGVILTEFVFLGEKHRNLS